MIFKVKFIGLLFFNKIIDIIQIYILSLKQWLFGIKNCPFPIQTNLAHIKKIKTLNSLNFLWCFIN